MDSSLNLDLQHAWLKMVERIPLAETLFSAYSVHVSRNMERSAEYIACAVHFQICSTSRVFNTVTQVLSHCPTTSEYNESGSDSPHQLCMH